jgi:hypothetical protein
MTMGNIGKMKKGALLEAFRTMVIGQLCMGDDNADAAVSELKAKGLRAEDLDWAAELALDADKFKKTFGEKALTPEFQALFKIMDDISGHDTYKGLYAGLTKKYAPKP